LKTTRGVCAARRRSRERFAEEQGNGAESGDFGEEHVEGIHSEYEDGAGDSVGDALLEFLISGVKPKEAGHGMINEAGSGV
jgi:hypothetical protein